ncbi:hypothetical protein BVZ64_00448B, partial [Haemophilus influenzae]
RPLKLLMQPLPIKELVMLKLENIQTGR